MQVLILLVISVFGNIIRILLDGAIYTFMDMRL